MNNIRTYLLAAMAVLGMTALAAPKPFPKVPQQAMKMLKGARGKPQSSGLVFINGRYLKPPYVVARYGTAIYINDVQATDQVVPWRSFLATQPGYSPKNPPKKPSIEAKSLDDLFDDAPPAGAPLPDSAKADAAEDEWPFTPNDRSAELLKTIDNYRTEVQRKLREGNVCFFGSCYARVVLEPRIAKGLLAVLPEAMRDANDNVDLEARLRAGGVVFINRTVCQDLLDNRADYLQLQARRKELQEEEAYQKQRERTASELAR